ncbi:PTS glucose transporter subunit IIA [Niallia taxi]|uniref:PTS sugar transporter subunit IIA n=1 Tax=Niallia taxi TaxID=2499688 RepID=UPI003981D1D8
MFKNSHQKKTEAHSIFTPADGSFVSLETVPDPIFSNKLVGEGFAVDPSNGIIVSPVTGEVTHISQTNHVMTIRNAEDIDVLIHIGLETSSLKGEPFKALVQLGQSVKKGEPLIDFNLTYLKDNAYSPLILVILPNIKNKNHSIIWQDEVTLVAGETKILSVVER